MMRKFFFLFFLFSLIILSGCSSGPGNYDTLAQCLTDSGAVMYGTEWCSHCQNQKKEFGSSFNLVNYVDCDRYSEECLKAGVRGYPTWVIEGEQYTGEQSLGKLASLTGC